MTAAALIAVVALVVIAVRELSIRRELERLRRDLAVAQAQLAERTTLADVGDMVSGLAQELKRPLQGMLGNTELMLATSGAAEPDAGDLRRLRDDAARAAGIVRDLLTVTETVALSRRWQDVNEVVDRAIAASLPELHSSGVRVEREPSERLPLVYVDGRQLEKVVAALVTRLSPALDAAGASGSRLFLVKVTAHRVLAPDDRVVVTVEDDGPAASTGDETIGAARLAGCRRVVEAHGGSLAVTLPSTTGRGVRAAIELPVATAPPVPVPQESSPTWTRSSISSTSAVSGTSTS